MNRMLQYHKLEESLKIAPDDAIEQIMERIQSLREKEVGDGE